VANFFFFFFFFGATVYAYIWLKGQNADNKG
jgi:hypothetical protein